MFTMDVLITDDSYSIRRHQDPSNIISGPMNVDLLENTTTLSACLTLVDAQAQGIPWSIFFSKYYSQTYPTLLMYAGDGCPYNLDTQQFVLSAQTGSPFCSATSMPTPQPSPSPSALTSPLPSPPALPNDACFSAEINSPYGFSYVLSVTQGGVSYGNDGPWPILFLSHNVSTDTYCILFHPQESYG
jgi:hypothetical protein